MKFIVIGALIVVAAAITLWILGGPQGPALKDVAYLKEPRIVDRSPQQVILVEMTGDPTNTLKVGCRILFKTYFKLPGVSRGSKVPAVIARWPKPFDTPRSGWLGRIAMPVPSGITSIPDVTGSNGVKPTLTTWAGGTVAEMLHVGSYATETPTIARLQRFISDAGYEICGEHEEEYLRSPGMFFAGNPNSYLTIIRYPVRKR
jgi:effector-binding domain-containing protein